MDWFGAKTDSLTSTRNLLRAFLTKVLKGAGMQLVFVKTNARGASYKHGVGPQLMDWGSTTKTGPFTVAHKFDWSGGCGEPAMAVATGNLKLPNLLHRTVTRTLSLELGAMMPEIRSQLYSPITVVGFSWGWMSTLAWSSADLLTNIKSVA
jgi:hypothetical protein